MSRRHRVGQLGPFNTPAAVQARLEQLRAVARSLWTDIDAWRHARGALHTGAEALFVQSFSRWLTGFDAYQPDWSDRLWGSTADQVESYARQLQEWRRQFSQLPGAKLTGPSAGTAITLGDALDKAFKGLGWAAAGVAAAVGLGVVLVLRGRQ